MAEAGGGAYVQAAAAAADVGGGLMTSAYSVHEARQNRRFQRNMSNTAHQREVEDLRAAGLNPILSATGGKGESTPSGNVPSIAEPTKLTGSVLQSQLQRAQLQNIGANTQKTLAEANSAETAARLNKASFYQQLGINISNAGLLRNQLQKSNIENAPAMMDLYYQSLKDQYNTVHSASKAAELQLPEMKARAGMYSSPLGKYLPYINSAKGVKDVLSK